MTGFHRSQRRTQINHKLIPNIDLEMVPLGPYVGPLWPSWALGSKHATQKPDHAQAENDHAKIEIPRPGRMFVLP